MPDRSSAKADLNLLAATLVEDPVTPVFWSEVCARSRTCGGEKTGETGFRDRLWTDVGF
jgi:hypothetical protein